MRFSLPVLCGVNARFRGREKCKVNKKGKSKKKLCRDIKKVEEKKTHETVSGSQQNILAIIKKVAP